MGLLDRFKKKGKSDENQSDGIIVDRLKKGYEVVEEYDVHKPIARIKIVKSPKLGEGLHYFVDESLMNEEETTTFEKIMSILSKEMEPPTDDDMTPAEYVQEQAEIAADKYHRALGAHSMAGWRKIFYYVVRDLAGYGHLHAMIQDPNIEDISNNGLYSPVYVWHRKYESIPSNITFVDEQTANDYIVKLAHRSAKHISSATPILDGMLPEKHRLAATFMNEVSTKGSTFCIRKFKSVPFSIVDLIKIGTLDARIAAYFWLILEHKMSFMIIGGTGAGKTSALNSLLSLMSRNDKIVTVEEIPELSPPLPNWTQLNSRQSFQFGQGGAASISIFDLVKVSLRYRPDYIIVGEIRGEEAYTLFQALATGHGGLCTMHADSLINVTKRLTSPPMNVSRVYIPLMNNAIHIQRVDLPKPKEGMNFGRRIRTIWEIEEYDQYREVAVWNPRNDTFETWFENSFLLDKISFTSGKSKQDLLIELEKRREYLMEIVESGIRDQRDVAEKILAYYTRQKENNRNGQDRKKRRKLDSQRRRQKMGRNEFEATRIPVLSDTETPPSPLDPQDMLMPGDEGKAIVEGEL
ncbi:MAG: type II/IV secretion system ATPase subunit [Candidatus Bathyarchaeota archaeon]|nr:MAG: type II/IV secretion system ATPase subunit [Candidatus Bathyarchaeota archaeon]